MIGASRYWPSMDFFNTRTGITSLFTKIELIKRHLSHMLEYYGEDIGVILFRKHVTKYIMGIQCNRIASFPGKMHAFCGDS